MKREKSHPVAAHRRSDAQAFAETMTSLEAGLKVEHVASDVIAAHVTEPVSSVRAWAAELRFNNVPVQKDGQIVGVLENLFGEITHRPRPPEQGSSKQLMRPLAGDMLIEGKAPLAGLVDELLRPPHYRLAVRNGILDGIVTPSDLSKLPMRVLAFAMLAQLETVMLVAIRLRYPAEEDAIDALGSDASAQILGELSVLHEKQLDPALLEVTTLRQKGEILARSGVFAGDAAEVCDGFRDLYDELRNPLMHASQYVDDSTAALVELQRRLAFVKARTNEAANMVPT